MDFNNLSVNWKIAITFIIILLIFLLYNYYNVDSKEETFDPKPYQSYMSGVYQPGKNDERDDNIDMEEVPWQENIQVLGLDPSVIDSHNSFVKDATATNRSASNMPVNDYFDGPVTFHGLSRARYHGVKVGNTARTVPTEYGDQLHERSGWLL